LTIINRDFIAQHRHEQVPPVALLALGDAPSGVLALLEGQRSGLLHQSLDLISAGTDQIRILSGPNLSWLRDLQPAIVFARLRGAEIRILCSPSDSEPTLGSKRRQIAAWSGADVAVASKPFNVRATMVGLDINSTTVLNVEKSPSYHGLVLKSPHEQGLIEIAETFFQEHWQQSTQRNAARVPRWRDISATELIDALKQGVPAYEDSEMSLESVRVESLRPLTRSLENFKLARLRIVNLLQEQFGVPRISELVGSPWPIIPPIVEEQSDGSVVVIDGTHRAFTATERGDEDLMALVVRGVKQPLPATPLTGWEDVKPSVEVLPRTERYDNYHANHFRPIRAAVAGLTTDMECVNEKSHSAGGSNHDTASRQKPEQET
jgi:hypothetical protein